MKRKVRVYRDREIQMTEENRGLWGEGGGERKRGTESDKDDKEKSGLMERDKRK